ncbi:MAG: ATP-binding protein [bacterium]|nr:ATP-binding protein [bacterium]
MSLQYNVSYEVASTIFLMILLCFINFQYDTSSKLNKEFRKLTWFGLIATMLDVTTAVTISYAGVVPVEANSILNTLYLISVAALGYQLTYYNLFYVYRNSKTSPLIRFNQIFICFYVVLLIYNWVSGCFFSFTRNGDYVKGPAHLAVYLSPCYFVTCSAIILIYNFRKFRRWQRFSILLFVLFQVSGLVLQMFFFPDTLLALFMSALGLMMMLFTMETPDYQKLVITIEELSETKKVAEEAKVEAEKAKEIAQQANRAKSDFLANMSHEIRTPINAVMGMDEMILRESDNPKILEYASDIKQAGGMLLSLINDILDFSKIESGKMDIIPIDYDLGTMLNDTIDMIRPRAVEKKLQLEVRIEPDTPVHLHGDEVRIRQVMSNILTNAVKYTAEGKVTLTVSGKKVSEGTVQLYVSVKDTGIGIKKEDIGRMFDSFQRVDESRNRNIEGTGLGLSITMCLLNLMGSRLEVESTYGTGSDFFFYLEQKQVDDEVIGADIQNYYENEKRKISVFSEQFYAPDAKILVVDDNEMNIKVFLGLLKNHGMQIETALSGKECLERIEKHAFHIIFMDYLMPEMDGVETLKRIRELKTNQSQDAVIIALTANAVSGAREMFLKEGFSDFLSKPVIATKLEKTIRKYLPKELIITTDSGQKREITVESGEPAQEAQIENSLVDWKQGRALCIENEDFYRELLQTFLDSHSDLQLRQYYEESDFENYRIKVHAIKSNLANIGAMRVSEMAKQIELALKNDNHVSYVREHHEEFMAAYERVVAEVRAYIQNTDDGAV